MDNITINKPNFKIIIMTGSTEFRKKLSRGTIAALALKTGKSWAWCYNVVIGKCKDDEIIRLANDMIKRENDVLISVLAKLITEKTDISQPSQLIEIIFPMGLKTLYIDVMAENDYHSVKSVTDDHGRSECISEGNTAYTVEDYDLQDFDSHSVKTIEFNNLIHNLEKYLNK